MIPLALLLYGLLASPCQANGLLPDPQCTPGDVAETDIHVLCGTPTRARRRVSGATRRLVFARYGVDPRQAPFVEVDHEIPLCLGGSNDISNLWIESAPGYLAKDRLEAELCRRVCSGRMRLEDAQHAIAEDWTAIRLEGL